MEMRLTSRRMEPGLPVAPSGAGSGSKGSLPGLGRLEALDGTWRSACGRGGKE